MSGKKLYCIIALLLIFYICSSFSPWVTYAQESMSHEQKQLLEHYNDTGELGPDNVRYQRPGQAKAVLSTAASFPEAATLPDSPLSEKTPSGSSKPHSAEKFSAVEHYFSATLSDEKKPRERLEKSPQALRQFGFEFFENTGAYTADAAALVGSEYVLGPGDALRIDVWGNIEGHYQLVIDRNGEIVLPKVGVINLWGQSFTEAKNTITRQIGKYFKQFQVNISLDSLRAINVYLIGEVEAPGSYQMSSLNTVLTALSAAGGPVKSGSIRQVKVMRGGQEVASVDFYDFLHAGDNRQDIRLQSGDTILVPIAGAQVGISGNVKRPGIYEILPGETLEDALAMAGGLVPTAYLQKIAIERIENHNHRTTIDLTLTDEGPPASEVRLQDGDLVNISSIVDAAGYVKLSGYVARPGDYQLSPGMRLADLILEYDNLLPEYFPGMAQLIRYDPPQFRPQSMTVDFDKALKGDAAHNILLQEYDEIHIYSRLQMEEIPYVVISGAVLNPGKYRLYEKMTVKDLVFLAGNVKRFAYLGEAEVTRYLPAGLETLTERHLINLEQAMAGDPRHNLLLYPDDQVIVRNIPDSGEKFHIELKGEMLFPGSYAIAKGERLSSVLTRAGGFTDKAYLRGAVFTRASLQAMQRKQMDKLIMEQEQAIYQVTSELAAGAMDQDQIEAAQINLESRKELLQKLRQAPVTGRMVVKISDIETFRDSEFDIEIMPGDVLTIPDNPHSVTVLGQVFNPTSLTYQAGKTASFYLGQVGGVTQRAEEDDMFILRADGTVISRQQGGDGMHWDSENSRWITGGFNVAVLYPGDAILVPEQVESTDLVREIKDISTIFFNFGLAAAAISVL